MRRIAIINQKGGVGKTTTTANLGAALAQAGKKTFLIDLDPQGHLTLHFGLSVQPDQATVYDVLTAATPIKEASVKARENVDVLPADIDLAAAEAELVSVTGREVLLREALQGANNGYDAMLIDCAPSLGVLTINALAACDEVVIPLQAHFFGLQGLGKLLETVMLVRQRINPQLKVSGIALCMHEAATRLATEVAEDLAKFLEAARGSDKPWASAQLYKTAIRRNIKLAESSSFGQTVFDYAPKSNGATDYANLAAEIFPGLPSAIDEGETAAEPVAEVKPRAVLPRAAPPERAARALAVVPKRSASAPSIAPEQGEDKERAARVPAESAPPSRRAPRRTSPAVAPQTEPTPGAEVAVSSVQAQTGGNGRAYRSDDPPQSPSATADLRLSKGGGTSRAVRSNDRSEKSEAENGPAPMPIPAEQGAQPVAAERSATGAESVGQAPAASGNSEPIVTPTADANGKPSKKRVAAPPVRTKDMAGV